MVNLKEPQISLLEESQLSKIISMSINLHTCNNLQGDHQMDMLALISTIEVVCIQREANKSESET